MDTPSQLSGGGDLLVKLRKENDALVKRLSEMQMVSRGGVDWILEKLKKVEHDRQLLIEENQRLRSKLSNEQGLSYLDGYFKLWSTLWCGRFPVSYMNRPSKMIFDENPSDTRIVYHLLHATGTQQLPLQQLAEILQDDAVCDSIQGQLLSFPDDLARRRLTYVLDCFRPEVFGGADEEFDSELLLDPRMFVCPAISDLVLPGRSGIRENVLGSLPNYSMFVRRSPDLSTGCTTKIEQALNVMDQVKEMGVWLAVSEACKTWEGTATYEIDDMYVKSDRLRLLTRYFPNFRKLGLDSTKDLVRSQADFTGVTGGTEAGLRTEEQAIGFSSDGAVDAVFASGQDVEELLDGFFEAAKTLKGAAVRSMSATDRISMAGALAFALLYINPLSTANGRVSRLYFQYMLHSVGLEALVGLPYSQSILEHKKEYREGVTGQFMKNVVRFSQFSRDKVPKSALPDTICRISMGMESNAKFFKYADLTREAEFYCDIVHHTVVEVIPRVVLYCLCAKDDFFADVDRKSLRVFCQAFDVSVGRARTYVPFRDFKTGDMCAAEARPEFAYALQKIFSENIAPWLEKII